MKRIGMNTVLFESTPGILSTAASVGKTEGEGPLAAYFDIINQNDGISKGTWEHAETELVKQATTLAMKKANVSASDIQIAFTGDLLNQCTASTFGFRDTKIPVAGLFGACSTFALAIFLASAAVDSGMASIAMAESSSHFCAAEKQFRFPLEYGGQRTPTAQRTVTGSGAVIIGGPKKNVVIKAGTVGKITDYGTTDMTNMGAAMAPAAAETIVSFLRDTNTSPEDYDMILTGDLGLIGSKILTDFLKKEYGIDIERVHSDCGVMIYDSEKQDTHAGGSGCGCSAAVVCSKIMQMLETKKLKRVLFAGTGALMSPLTVAQGDTIPCIAHAVYLTGDTEGGN